MTTDRITFAVVKAGLEAIVDDMAYTVVRTARSEIVKDVMDFSCALCTTKGEVVAQAKTIALHLGSVPDAIAEVLRVFEGDLHPGDAVILNDPFRGGMHLPDVFMFMPYFADGERIGFGVVICHQTDMGGRVPGSNASDSTEIFQEGLRIPPLKLYERGKRVEVVAAIIAQNVRVPERVLGDIGAQFAACRVGERELGRLAARYGAEALQAYMEELLDYAERLTRDEIRRWPDGTYRFTDYIDDDGRSDTPLPITAAVTVAGDRLLVDYAGSAPQVKAAINATLSFTKSATYLTVRCLLPADVPSNEGVFRCVEVQAPERSILNLAHPAPCAARALTGYRVVDTLLGAFAQVVPDRVPAAGEGGNTVVCLSGERADGSPFIIVDMLCGAWGGRPGKDGIEAITNPAQNLSNTPVEVLEAQHPVRVEAYELLPDSCGAGKHRGGLGLARDYRVLADEAILQLRSDRMRFPPWGLEGGGPARTTRNILNPAGEARGLPGKVYMTLHKGDVIRHEQPGGGGWGDPLDRDPSLVAHDLAEEKITPAFAQAAHAVVVDPRTGEVDPAATRELRAQRRAAAHGRR